MKLQLATRRNLAALRDGVQVDANALQKLAARGYIEQNSRGWWQIKPDVLREFNRRYPRP